MCMTPTELSICIHDLKELRTLQNRIADKIKTLEEQVKEHMSDTEMYTLIGDDYSVSWYEVSSSRIDTTSLKREHPEIAAQYMCTTTTRRFIIS